MGAWMSTLIFGVKVLHVPSTKTMSLGFHRVMYNNIACDDNPGSDYVCHHNIIGKKV